MPESTVHGRHVLIVEDEYYFADELNRAFEEAGALVLGPVPSAEAALDLLDDDTVPDIAVLDLNLGGRISFRVADSLLARNIPFVFATGYDQEIVPERHGAVRWLRKPLDTDIVVTEAKRLIVNASTAGRPEPVPSERPRRAAVMDTRNTLLAPLSPDDRALVIPHIDRITLRLGDVLYEPMQPIEHVYFPEGAFVSIVAVNPDGKAIEVGCAGREGCAGVATLLGADASPHRTIVQVGGMALRMPAGALKEAIDRSPSLQAHLLRYVHVFMVQIAATALADGRYKLEQRLARWLLMAHDRLEGDRLPLTHEFLALMLGVRRPGVTDAMHVLEGEQILKAKRGRITVIDRKKLEEMAAGSYGIPEAEYRRLIGGDSGRY